MEDLLAFRHRMTEEHGALTLDKLFPHYRCGSCKRKWDGNALITIGEVQYQDVQSLVAFASALAKNWMKDAAAPPVCEACKVPMKLEHVDYHAFHSGVRKDLVVRTQASTNWLGQHSSAMFWWSPQGSYEQIARMTREEELRVSVDAKLRAAAAACEVSGIHNAVEAIKNALEVAGGDSALMSFVPPLVGIGRTGLAGAIVDAHIQAHPDDASGHFHLAEIVIQVVAHGDWPIEKLAEAEEHLQRALELRPRYPEAETAQANLLRLRGNVPAARASFLALIQKYPDQAEPHYNLGVMDLEDRPEQALHHFSRGRELSPDDPDYPLGQARAYIKLGQHDKAREAIQGAKELAPEYPKIAEIEGTLPQPD